MNKLASCLVTLGFASLTCAQAVPPRNAETSSPRRGEDLLSELRQLHGELRELRTLVEQMVKESTLPAYDLRIEGGDVTLAFTRELTLPEFLRLAQEVTSARYVYDSAQVATAGPVTFVGRIHCQRSEFPAFVDTMLYIHGLYAQARGSADGRYIEVGRLQGRPDVSSHRRNDRMTVPFVTCIAFSHDSR